DARFVLFRSSALNLAPGSYPYGAQNLFLRDLQLNRTYALSTNGLFSPFSMTPNGRFVAFTGGSSGTFYVWDSLTSSRVATNGPVRFAGLGINPDGNR